MLEYLKNPKGMKSTQNEFGSLRRNKAIGFIDKEKLVKEKELKALDNKAVLKDHKDLLS